MGQAIQYGIDMDLVTNLCGRTVKPNDLESHCPQWWPWSKKFKRHAREERIDPATNLLRIVDPVTQQFVDYDPHIDSPTFPGIEAERAEIVAVYRGSSGLRLKIKNERGQIGDIEPQHVLLVD